MVKYFWEMLFEQKVSFVELFVKLGHWRLEEAVHVVLRKPDQAASKGKGLLFVHVHQEESSDEALALAVADLREVAR